MSAFILLTDLIHIEPHEVGSIIIPYFTIKESVIQRRVVIFPRPSSCSMAKPKSKPSSKSRSHTLRYRMMFHLPICNRSKCTHVVKLQMSWYYSDSFRGAYALYIIQSLRDYCIQRGDKLKKEH